MQLSFFRKQLLVDGFTPEDQKKLNSTRVVVVGLGGLGCSAAPALAGTGIGKMRLVDFDRVEESNLHRQLIYRVDDIGQSKAMLAAEYIRERYKHTDVEGVDETFISNHLEDCNLVIDCTDNVGSRKAIAAACADLKLPYIYTAAQGRDIHAMACNFKVDDKYSISYNDIYEELQPEGADCNTEGILGVSAVLAGAFQAHLAINALLRPSLYVNKLFLWNSSTLLLKILEAAPQAEVQHNNPMRNVPAISPQMLLQKKNEYRIIDIRQSVYSWPDELAVEHIPYYDLLESSDSLDTDTKYVLCCEVGMNSWIVTRKLLALRHDLEVYSLAGGYTAILKEMKRS